jgi:hypothetical protein
MLTAYRAGDIALADSNARKLCGEVPPIWCALYHSMADRFADVAPAQQQPGIRPIRVLDNL